LGGLQTFYEGISTPKLPPSDATVESE